MRRAPPLSQKIMVSDHLPVYADFEVPSPSLKKNKKQNNMNYFFDFEVPSPRCGTPYTRFPTPPMRAAWGVTHPCGVQSAR
jgi:hypothetical protein